MNKMKTILLLIIGIIVGGAIGIKASELISSSQVIYKENKTVATTLDELFNELLNGKEKLATAITNKGIDTTSDNTLEEMANNIDSIVSSDLQLLWKNDNPTVNYTGGTAMDLDLTNYSHIILEAQYTTSNSHTTKLIYELTQGVAQNIAFITSPTINAGYGSYANYRTLNISADHKSATIGQNGGSMGTNAGYKYDYAIPVAIYGLNMK